MFPTFSGNSRRPRNVNLSGQRSTNPWASSGWAAAPSGASQTVAHAQIEREKRQRERDEIAATKRIQRFWRGHKARGDIQIRHRKEWDTLYEGNMLATDRVEKALPLILVLFDAKNTEDQHRLDQLISDLNAANVSNIEDRQWRRLASVLVAALEQRPRSLSQDILRLLIEIIKRRPGVASGVMDRYYKLVTVYCGQNSDGAQPELSVTEQQQLSEAISAPLAQDDRQSYESFAFSFLTSSELLFLQRNPSQVVRYLNLQTLSQSIINGLAKHNRIQQASREELLWLLAHYIALNRASSTSQGAEYLDALYRQLTELAPDIRMRTNPRDEDDASDDDADESTQKLVSHLAPFVMDQLQFLVNEDGIAELLSRFTSSATLFSRMTEDASLLAGYTLILLRCFPNHGDDIKMRLFQGDISTDDSNRTQSLPSVKYFWNAVSRTKIFPTIAQTRADQKSVISLLQPDVRRDSEWRMLLLFLELYNFLLRVTDDEDFLSVDGDVIPSQSAAASRIRASGLRVTELKELVTFLKNVSFPLYYNLHDVLPTNSRSTEPSVSSIFGSSSTTSRDFVEKTTPSVSPTHADRIDVLALRATATTTMRALYDRDSRRPFLPKDFWLMTSKFDMDSFLSAVMLEEQRKSDAENEDEDEDEDMEDADDTRFDGFHTATGHRISRAAQIERRRQYKRALREKHLAQAGPKLEILRNMPYTIPFEVRVQIFRQFVYLDKLKRRGGHVEPEQWRMFMAHGGFQSDHARSVLGRHTGTIKRGQVFNDAFDQFYSLAQGLKEPIQITFVDQFDQPEAGIDGGGVTKEFLTSVTNEAFNPEEHGLFVANSQNLLYPNPTAYDERIELLQYVGIPEKSSTWNSRLEELSNRYEFLGRIVGKCMYEGILIDIAFASFFLLKWASSRQSSSDFRGNLNDLRDLDPELYKGLITLKNYPGDVSDLALDFTINDRVSNPQTGEVRTITRPLCKDGENIPVTNRNRPLYISYVAHHRLVAQPLRQTKAFLRGLGSIIDPSWLSMFNQSELQRLVGGDSSEIDVEDLRKNTVYSGLYAIGDDGLEHPTIEMFWQVMHELEDEQRREVLKYVTSTPRAPLLGFSQLSPRFSVRDGGTDEKRLPSTSTCVNLLKLPRYSSAKLLKSKLLYAVQSGAGFDLS